MKFTVIFACIFTIVFGALVTDPNDSRTWQGASVGTFASLFYGSNTYDTRSQVVGRQLLDDGILTANLSQTGTLLPTSWAVNYGGCSGYSTNNNYDYTCSSGKNVFELANSIDAYWFQSPSTYGNAVWDLGAISSQAAIFVTIDHGPLPVEAIESTHYLSDSATGPWAQAEVVRVYLQGYILDESPKGLYDGFTYVVRHPNSTTFRYISSNWGGSGALQSDGDDEINGVAGLDLYFNPVRNPLSECINFLAAIPGNDTVPVNPVLLTGKYTSTASTNYGYSSYDRKAGSRILPAPQSDTLIFFFTQDYQNTFSLNFLLDSNDNTRGNLTLKLTTTNLGNSAGILVYDDPSSSSSDSTDIADKYQWFPSSGNGQFEWAWGPTTTDGVVIGPLSILNTTKAFTIRIEVLYRSGISKFLIASQNGESLSYINVGFTSPLTIRRESCSCGDGKIDTFEECDGGFCCTSKCALRNGGLLCRSSNGVCDTAEYCDGVSGYCPADSFLGNSVQCRDSQGDCDPAEYCSGSSASCPSDSKSTSVCRPATGDCDVSDSCDGVVNSCSQIADAKKANGTTCDDQDACSSSSTCAGGICAPVAYDLCQPKCGDGVLDSGAPYFEECDDGNKKDGDCCSSKCKFEGSSQICRPSTGRCDPTEYCRNNSATCPADDSSTCITCLEDCNNHGTCNPDSEIWVIGDIGDCDCDPGYTGNTCGVGNCSHYDNCTGCSTNALCGWCCSTGACINGNATGASAYFCEGWQYQQCGCNPSCVGGTCQCGKCVCDVGRSGAACDLYIGCDGNSYANATGGPKTDICGVCGGNGTSCLGCDGVAFSGKTYDHCGVCGGKGESCQENCPFTDCEDCAQDDRCHWCKGDEKCYEKRHAYDCPKKFIDDSADCSKFFGDLTVAEAAGLGAGIIAAIVIGVVFGALLLGFGSKKGYDVYMKYRDNFEGAHSNPIYEDRGLSGENPFFEKERTNSQ